MIDVSALLNQGGIPAGDITPISGGDICDAWRIQAPGPVGDGSQTLFANTARGPRPGMFPAEAAGLTWLRDAGAHTPEVRLATEQILVLEWLTEAPATTEAARRLGVLST